MLPLPFDFVADPDFESDFARELDEVSLDFDESDDFVDSPDFEESDDELESEDESLFESEDLDCSPEPLAFEPLALESRLSVL